MFTYYVTAEQKRLINIGDEVIKTVKTYFPHGAGNFANNILKSNGLSAINVDIARDLGLKRTGQHARYSAYKSIYGQGGNCEEHATLAFIVLREKLVLEKVYKIALLSDTIRDHAFTAILLDKDRDYLIGDDIIVDAWPPDAQAMLFKHHNFFRISQKSKALIVRAKIADGKKYMLCKNDVRVSAKYKELYHLEDLTEEKREKLVNKYKDMYIRMYKIRYDQLGATFVGYDSIYRNRTTAVNELKFIYTEIPHDLEQLFEELNPIVNNIYSWGANWELSVNGFTRDRAGQSKMVIQTLNLIDRRATFIDNFVTKPQLIAESNEYSKLFAISCLLLFKRDPTAREGYLLDLFTVIKQTGTSYIPGSKSPLEELRVYYWSLLMQERNPKVLSSEEVQFITTQLWSKSNYVIFYLYPCLTENELFDRILWNLKSWIKEWKDTNLTNKPCGEHLLGVLNKIEFYKKTILSAVMTEVNKPALKNTRGYCSKKLFLATLLSTSFSSQETLLSLLEPTRDNTEKSPFTKLRIMWKTIVSLQEEQTEIIQRQPIVTEISTALT